ncbi:MAG: folate-binding protein YgfZ, partial [Betaproteobacteria bacterium]|nr:folate-binding protein YgfZ [Betaproteobacteria bacterium]
GLIRVAGPDAAGFLHNLLTNDVKGLPADAARRYGFCNVKGRLLANMLMWREADDLLIALSADLHALILKKLSMFVLRSKVKLTDAGDERVLLGLSGPQAEAALAELGQVPTEVLMSCRNEYGQVIRLEKQRYLLSLEANAAQAAWLKLTAHARPAGLSAWHWLEILAGMPCITAATQEEFIPQMVNYEMIGGVSFTKGCYPGQEIVARTQYLGKIKRRMYRARLESGAPLAGAHLYAPETGEQSCGRIVNVAPSPQGGNEVLAVIQSTCADAGEVHLDTPAGPRLLFQPLPYDVNLPQPG